MEDIFEFSAPISFEKGIGESEPKELVIAGIASTTSQDFDGEFMNPKGFDTTYFEKFGFINWAHQSTKDPSSIIGRPSEVRIDTNANNLFVKSTLFKSSEKARQVYKLGQVLEAEGYSLAYSIEGKVVERDKQDPRRVLKAKITGCAVTPTPKNNDSSAMIQKGIDDLVKGFEGTDSYDFIKSMLSEEETEEEKKKKKEKKKAMDAASVQPVTKESVEKKPKDTTPMLTKGQVMTILREDLPNTSEEMREKVYELTVKIEKSVSMETPEVTPESLAKAYETLDITKGTDAAAEAGAEVTEENPTQVAEEGATVEEPETEAPVVEEEPETEAEIPETEEEEIEKSIDAPSEEAIEASKMILKSVGYEVFESATEESSIEKSVAPSTEEAPADFTSILRTELEVITKGNNEKFGAISTLFKGMESKISGLESRNYELEELVKGFGSMSQGRRSVTAHAAIEKSIEADGLEETPANTLSISNPAHKMQILKKGDDMSGLTSGNVTNPALAEEVAMYESSNFINPQGHLAKAMTEAGFTLVK